MRDDPKKLKTKKNTHTKKTKRKHVLSFFDDDDDHKKQKVGKSIPMYVFILHDHCISRRSHK